MVFVVIGRDGRDAQAPSRRLAARAAHLELAGQMRQRGELLYAVALLDEDEQMVGSICIVELPSRVELDAWLSAEPYVRGKVWESVEVTPGRVPPIFAR